MKNRLAAPLHSALLICLLLLTAAACGSDSPQPNSTLEVTSDREPNAWITGTVTYRERIALSLGASLEVELRDVSYADASAPLIARQVISNPGQVPIEFKLGYNKEDIDSGNRYSVSASIFESEGWLAFTNDTAHEVITRGNRNEVDMVLVLVQPPPDLVDKTATDDWRTWIEVPVRVVSANFMWNEPEQLVMVKYYQSNIEGCARPGNEEARLHGSNIDITVTLMQPLATSWAIPCDEDLVELGSVARIKEPLKPGETYRIRVNDSIVSTISLPDADFTDTVVAESLIESVDVEILESAPPQYHLRVVSGMPKGSGCSRFNGYEIRRAEPTEIEVRVTHHEVADPFVICTADFPVLQTSIPLGPLGSDSEPGVEYTVVVNGQTEHTFVAQ